MAQRVQTLLVSDLSGEDLDTRGVSVTFGYQGAAYEIDLSESEAREFDEVMEKYIKAGRRTGGRRSSGGRGVSSAKTGQLQKMREWAKENGYKVSDRGRVSKEVQDAYAAAH